MNELLEDEETAVSRLSAKELMAVVESLPEGFKAVFNLYAIEGYSHKEIAEMLHITESTSRSQYVRARKWLQERIERY
jgi:RNA polymerase sigma-70 factor (ECF subfamily)